MPVNPFKWKVIVSPGIAGLDDSKGAGPPATSIGGGAGGGGGESNKGAVWLPPHLRFIYLLSPMTSKVSCSLHFYRTSWRCNTLRGISSRRVFLACLGQVQITLSQIVSSSR